MNYTPNYHLPTWAMTDRIQMSDFNDMTARIDAALAAEKTAREGADAAHTTELAKRGNCQVYISTYTGTGQSGEDHPSTLTFSKLPLVVWIFNPDANSMCIIPGDGSAVNQTSGATCLVKWQGNKVTWYVTKGPAYGQMNAASIKYTVIALCKAD